VAWPALDRLWKSNKGPSLTLGVLKKPPKLSPTPDGRIDTRFLLSSQQNGYHIRLVSEADLLWTPAGSGFCEVHEV